MSRAFHSHLSIRCRSCRGWVVYQGQVKWAKHVKTNATSQRMHWALAQTDETQSMRLSLSYHKVMRMAGWWELDELPDTVSFCPWRCFPLMDQKWAASCPAWTFKFPCCLRPQNTTVAVTPRNELSVRCSVAHTSAWLSSSSCELCLLPFSFSILQNLC